MMTQLSLPFKWDDDPANYYTWSDIPRPTEDQAFWNIIHAHKPQVIDLTDKQCQAWELHCEAKRLEILPSRYIAQEMGITQDSAKRLLNRAEQKIVVLEQSVSVYNEDSIDMPYATREKIRKLTGSMTVRCAAQGTENCNNTASARYGICKSCSETYGYPDNMRPHTRNWLPEMIKHVKGTAYNEAKHIIEQQIINSNPAGKPLRQIA